MAPGCLTEITGNMLSKEHRQLLLELARKSIEYGLEHGKAITVELSQYPECFREKKATFVTLKRHNELRGCIGILKPVRSLAEDVAHNAWAAAFTDSRFSPLTKNELDGLDIHISILGTPEDIEFDSEEDLISKIQTGVDGLILEDGINKGTFLPSVWESVPNAREFLNHLKQKAGLPATHWSDSIRVQRYAVEEI